MAQDIELVELIHDQPQTCPRDSSRTKILWEKTIDGLIQQRHQCPYCDYTFTAEEDSDIRDLDVEEPRTKLQIEADESGNGVFQLTFTIYGFSESTEKDFSSVAFGSGTGHIITLTAGGIVADTRLRAEYSGQEVGELVHAAAKHFDDEFITRVVTLDTMRIHPAYRGLGVGLKVMDALTTFFAGDVILAHPSPLDCDDDDLRAAGQVKLRKYWENAGFRAFGDEGYCYFHS